jgi:hypothetical protein
VTSFARAVSSSGVIWIKQGNKWLNQLASTTGTPQLNFYLTGLGNGSQYVVGTSSPGSGTFQQFSFVQVSYCGSATACILGWRAASVQAGTADGRTLSLFHPPYAA